MSSFLISSAVSAYTPALEQIVKGLDGDAVLGMGAEELCRLDDKLFGRAVLLHFKQLVYDKAIAHRGAFAVDYRYLEIGIDLKQIVLCQVGRAEGPGDAGREADIKHLVAALGIGLEGLAEHVLVYMIGADIDAASKHVIEGLGEDILAVEMIYAVDDDRGGDDQQVVFVNYPLGHVAGRIGYYFKRH